MFISGRNSNSSASNNSAMVITFDTRFQDIKNRCAPLLGKRRLEMQAPNITASKNPKSGITQSTGGNQLHTRDTEVTRQKRQKHERAYAAATIEEALAQAGRPAIPLKKLRRERALPAGSVDLSLAKVVSSSEYDESSKASQAADGCTTTENEEVEQDVYFKAFYTSYPSLILSTRNYYNVFESKFTNDENEKKSESSSSIEGLSSWTPTSSNHDLNDNKEIDNDNRSDELSLDAGEGYISDSLSCEFTLPPNKAENEIGSAFSLVG